MIKIYLSLFLSLALLALSGCSSNESSQDENLQSFDVKGVLLRVENEGRTLIIKHEEIPGYMGAMTMPFRVKDTAESEKASPGDEIRFTYQVAELESWVENIEPTGVTETVEIPEPDPALKKND